jgi:hypothetical protein
MTALPAILSPQPEDNEDVVSALETADIFWTKGDTDEAMRWLKRAAETASDAGNDNRAFAIARSVADLKSEPAAAATEGARKSRPPPPSAIHHASHAPAAALSSSQQPDLVEARRLPVPSAAPSTSGNGPLQSHTSSAPHRMPPPLPPSKLRESTAPPAPSSRQSAAPLPAGRPSVSQAPSRTPSVEPAPPVRRSASPSTLPKEPERAITPGTAFRGVAVFVRPEGRDGEKLEVILAKPGQPVPAGAEPALLVPTRRGGRLLA